ncbi:ribosome small subunit-dependent GTPase A [Oleiharenicola lentus]|uniref:ribosome small subunit-dependent GTPase A n=1 Tax=Oleiharenicola lentus TaxID=2508720 RepID=UPI003F6694F8
MTLAELGWNDFFANAFAPLAAEGGVPARVTLELKGYYEVTGENGAKLGECSGKFLNTAKTTSAYPAIGDWVVVTPQTGDDSRVAINAVLPRRTKFARRAAGLEPLEQVVAANIDTIFIVSGLDGNYHLHRVERYLATTWAGGARPVILLNKADLSDETDALLAELREAAPTVPVHVVSAQTRRGLKALTPYLEPGKTVALLGSSGVGKSTLINRLMGDKVQFTQEVRENDSKGRHTTTQRELLVTPEGAIIIDTPGMREIQPWAAGDALAENYNDVISLTHRCKFTNCTHTQEPGCAVRAAKETGTLTEARWESYQRLLRAIAHEIRQFDRPAARQHREQVKKQTKHLRRRVHEKHGEE